MELRVHGSFILVVCQTQSARTPANGRCYSTGSATKMPSLDSIMCAPISRYQIRAYRIKPTLKARLRVTRKVPPLAVLQKRILISPEPHFRNWRESLPLSIALGLDWLGKHTLSFSDRASDTKPHPLFESAVYDRHNRAERSYCCMRSRTGAIDTSVNRRLVRTNSLRYPQVVIKTSCAHNFECAIRYFQSRSLTWCKHPSVVLLSFFLSRGPRIRTGHTARGHEERLVVS